MRLAIRLHFRIASISIFASSLLVAFPILVHGGDPGRPLSLSWEREILTIRGTHLPGGELKVWYLEAFCHPGSTHRDWKQTVIPHATRLIEADRAGKRLVLRSELEDGVRVDHEIEVGDDVVDFRLVASNQTERASEAHWAQPCIRVDRFTNTRSERGSEAYLPKCFIMVDGKVKRMPVEPWAREARYTPGQVWCPRGVSREDVNPRPLSSVVPSSGLIGCFSADGTQIMATAWEPFQELFQGIIVCLHSDFRIGGLKPGETKTIRGKIYLMPGDIDGLLARYRRDFPEHQPQASQGSSNQVRKKLIEFGWDEPDTSFLRANRELLEKTPFDGCVFHVDAMSQGKPAGSFTWLGWGRRRFSEAELSAALDDLRSLKGTRFRENFLRFNTTPADLDWFDDHEAILANARLAGRMARAGGCAGILLDTEQYQGALFNYRKQRDATRKSWSAYSAQARRRGREVMAAFQEGYPGLTVMATFGPSLVWIKGQEGKTPLADLDCGLLVPFFDGMIEAARGTTRLVDGFEPSYGYRDPDRFEKAREIIKTKAAGLMVDPVAYRKIVGAGFGLWLDYDWRKMGWNIDNLENNYFTPKVFESSVRKALSTSDEYVWIYCERPRWWTAQGPPAELPPAYEEALAKVKTSAYARE